MIRADPRYEWTLVDNRLIDIYPRNRSQRFLDITIPRFDVEDKTRNEALDQLTGTQAVQQMLSNLHARLHTPTFGALNLRDLGPKITVDLKDVSLRTILNAIVLDSGGSGWSAVRYGSHLQYLSLSVGG